MPMSLTDNLSALAATFSASSDGEPLWLQFRKNLYSSIVRDASDESALIRHAYGTVWRTRRGIAQLVQAAKMDAEYRSAQFLTVCINALYANASSATQSTFDRWHEEACIGLQSVWRDTFPLTTGQAQKWVNIVMKYHAAFGTKGCHPFIRARYLSYLHVPVDNQVYNFLVDAWNDIPVTVVKPDWFMSSSCLAWSKIELYSLHYMTLQRLFRQIVAEHSLPTIALDLAVWQPDSGAVSVE